MAVDVATAPHDIIVVGASGGGVEALTRLVGDLPAGLAGAVFLVLHTSPDTPSVLAQILARASALPTAFAEHGQPIVPGTITVSRPDHHLLLDDRGVVLDHGPVENHVRPAIDALFRSAAKTFGPRVIAVLLTGMLRDGSAGVVAVRKRGGLVVVQDPSDAMFSDMPRNAIAADTPDHVVPLDAIGPLLARLVGTCDQSADPRPRTASDPH